MKINCCTGYFHDGTLIDIKHKEKNIDLILESSEIDPNEFTEKENLSKRNTLIGVLHVINVKKIKVENKEYKGILKKEYDDCEILELKIHCNNLLLLIEWKNFPPKKRLMKYSEIEIEAEVFFWQNIPRLLEEHY